MPSKSPKLEAAYVAGLFDGEGTVAIYESWAIRRDGTRRPVWIYQVQIANTFAPVLEAIAAQIGGAVVKKSRGKAHWRQGFVWRVCGDEAADFMAWIRPYAIVKADEIDEALKFRSLCRPRGEFQTEEQIQVKRAVVARLKAMKRAISQLQTA